MTDLLTQQPYQIEALLTYQTQECYLFTVVMSHTYNHKLYCGEWDKKIAYLLRGEELAWTSAFTNYFL